MNTRISLLTPQIPLKLMDRKPVIQFSASQSASQRPNQGESSFHSLIALLLLSTAVAFGVGAFREKMLHPGKPLFAPTVKHTISK